MIIDHPFLYFLLLLLFFLLKNNPGQKHLRIGCPCFSISHSHLQYLNICSKNCSFFWGRGRENLEYLTCWFWQIEFIILEFECLPIFVGC